MRDNSDRRSPVRAKMRAAVTDAILEAAEHVALENGLEAATTAAIAARAGVAVGTLYNYFPDRHGLLVALFKTRRAELVPKIDGVAKAHASLPFEDQLRAYVRDVLAIFDAHRNFLRLAIIADREGMPLKGKDTTLMTKMIADLEAIFRAGAAKKKVPAARVEVYARVAHGAIKAVAVWRIDQGSPMAPDADLIVDGLLHGIAAG